MIRKPIVAVLTLLTTASLVFGILGYVVPTRWGMDRVAKGKGVAFGFYDGFLDFRFEGRFREREMTLADHLKELRAPGAIERNKHEYRLGSGGFHLWWYPRTDQWDVNPDVTVSVGTHVSVVWWCPFWMWSLAFGVVPAIAFVRGPLRRMRRWRRGLCVSCGYDLTGLQETRCPECGLGFERRRGRKHTESESNVD
jgi:hypothetical protein